MNRCPYRLVFNRSLRLWQVASERTGSAAIGVTAARPAARARQHALVTALLVCVAGGNAAQAQAQIVADHTAPTNQQPSVQAAGNGVPVVTIQTPSAGGVSRNTYAHFDIDHQGAILNNARGPVQTQLGGWIQANPHLAGGSAEIILNEVNSPNPLKRLTDYPKPRSFIGVDGPA